MTKTPPNIVLLMADQLTAFALSCYGNRVCQTPNLDRLVARATRFASTYCNFPLCAPARVAMLTGRLPSSVGVYDNASEFSAEIPTFVHHLTLAGYRTVLSGKMHFVGPDQLHGYQERLTTDIYPSDFGWTPDWRQEVPLAPTGMNMRSVIEAGACRRSLQMDYDDEVVHRGVQALYDLGRTARTQPFFLTVSLTHPHNPYLATEDYLALYPPEQVDMPRVAPIPLAQRDRHSQRLWYLFRQDEHAVTDHQVRMARRAYYAMVSYVDAQVGRLLAALDAMDLTGDTAVIFTSDHGDMLGERGLWYKWVHFEPAVRVPLLIAMPGQHQPTTVSQPVSLVDMFPTVLEMAGVTLAAADRAELDGRSLLAAASDGHVPSRPVFAEMNGEGAHAPCLMVRDGAWKLIVAEGDPPQLYNLEADPDERHNRAGEAAVQAVEQALWRQVLNRWQPDRLHAQVLASQARRRLVQQSRLAGALPAWDYQPHTDASQQFVRSGAQSSPALVKARMRYPPVAATPVDYPRPDDASLPPV